MKIKSVYFFVVLLLFVAAMYILQQKQQNPPPHPASPSVTPSVLGIQTKTSGCQAKGALADSACTPGAVNKELTKEVLCNADFTTKNVRNVPASEKRQVYDEYGITTHQPGQYEIDHLISLELGGSNDLANLWPEAAEPRPGFHEKDIVENYLHKQVCSGEISLQDAQAKIASDWLQVYQSIGLGSPP